MKRTLTLAAALAAGLAAAPAGAQSLRIAHGYPAQSIIGATYDHFAEYVEANSEIEAEVFALTSSRRRTSPRTCRWPPTWTAARPRSPRLWRGR